MLKCVWLNYDEDQEIAFCSLDTQVCFIDNCEDYEAEEEFNG